MGRQEEDGSGSVSELFTALYHVSPAAVITFPNVAAAAARYGRSLQRYTRYLGALTDF